MTTLFSKIIRGEIPSQKVFENELVYAFKDINPVAPIHILIVPKKEIPSLQSVEEGDFKYISEIIKVAQDLASELELDRTGYRLLTNIGRDAGQTVPHLHFHLIGGKALGDLG
jgi:histidine triad (HIT) family protein